MLFIAEHGPKKWSPPSHGVKHMFTLQVHLHSIIICKINFSPVSIIIMQNVIGSGRLGYSL